MSYQVARMVKRGLVGREQCADDARGAHVVLTPAGREALEAAAPHHAAVVRRLIVDVLSPDDLATYARISNVILAQMDSPSP
ncbi:hypothetical protein GCM10023083_09180 [Streptomyces phyllanthi]